MNSLLILIGKTVSLISKSLNKGHGSTWPGHIALSLNKNFIKDVLAKNPNLKIILIAGTNGKTTTSKLIRTILEHAKIRVVHNESGANLLNGIASVFINFATISTYLNYNYAVFEVDENSLPLVLNELIPHYVILLNLFRDQLDRYGEVNTVASKWQKAIEQLGHKTIVILNADDPQIAWLGLSLRAKRGNLLQEEIASSYFDKLSIPRNDSTRSNLLYFGLNEKTKSKIPQHASDSTYCPNCNTKLSYKSISFSHLGNWHCPNCKDKRPKLSISSVTTYPLPGMYNRYNTLAAVLLCRSLNIELKVIDSALQDFEPAFGRQEILNVNSKKVQLFLSKNPTSFNQSLQTIYELNAKNILMVLNDKIPDGRDVSWIWDVDFEEYLDPQTNIAISGDRCFDMGVRIKYSMEIKNCSPREAGKLKIEEDLKKAINMALYETPRTEILYILPTYSAMLEVRKILTGKKIL